MTDTQRFTELVHKYITGSLTAEELRLMQQWLDDPAMEAVLEAVLRENYRESATMAGWDGVYKDKVVEGIMAKVGAQSVAGKVVDERWAPRAAEVVDKRWAPGAAEVVQMADRRRSSRRFMGYAAAVVLVIAMATGWWMMQRRNATKVSPTVQDTAPLVIGPGGDRAILTLSDGSQVVLDSAASGAIAQQGNIRIIKTDSGKIVYEVGQGTTTAVAWNTLHTPKGGQYKIVLPDGTRAWLNALSSLKFPTMFTGSKRVVKVEGEVYFEVATNKQQPFLVDVDGQMEVEVLGTSFDVNAYRDEGVMRTSLLEGSVRVSGLGSQKVLKPGYQALIKAENGSGEGAGREGQKGIAVREVDTEQVLAWKNGIFNFNGADLRSVMRQLERWYDIRVQYGPSVSNIKFKGSMYRNVNLSNVLDMLSVMGVRFRMEGNTIIVK